MNRTGIFVLSAILGTAPMVRAGTKLSNAALKNDVAKIQTLLASGENIDEIDKWGWTPLMWAVFYKYAPAAQCLLDHKANPNVQATKSYSSISKGSTPLIICGYYGLDDFAKMLLKAGANRNIVNEKGKKAIDYAREFNFDEMVRLLTEEKPKTEPPKTYPSPKAQPAPVAQPSAQPLPKLVPSTAQPVPQPATQPPAQPQTQPQTQPVVQPTTPSTQPSTTPAKKSKKTAVKKKSEPPAIK